MMWAMRSSGASGLSKPGISLALERDTVGELRVEMERVLGPPVERRKIDMDEAEPSAVAVRPFEIVEQRPHEIAAHRHAGGDGVEHRTQITAQIGDPLLVANPPICVRAVGKGSAVLEDIDRQIAA